MNAQKMSLPVDFREVLAILNDLGYRNISAEQLKEFVKDLKKLIKYEDRLCVPHTTAKKPDNTIGQRFEQLHKTQTASFQAKAKQREQTEGKEKECSCDQKPLKPRNSSKIRRSKSVPRNTRTCNKAPLQSATDENIKEIKKQNAIQERKTMPMWIRPRSTPTPCTGRRPQSDPVQLYQYYKEEWNRFKQNLPGENDHTELRWAIRHKLARC